ncbi:MAG: P-II family nitrogen regulator [bacterium]
MTEEQNKQGLVEIKAYIRPERVSDVIGALENLGVCQMTIIDVQAMGRGVDPKDFKYSFELVERYSTLARLELVCPHVRTDAILEAIADQAHTGQRGDGFAYVTPVRQAVDLRTGSRLSRTVASS